MAEFNPEVDLLERHDQLVGRAWRFCEPLVYAEGDPDRALESEARMRLEWGLQLFVEAVEIVPERWETHWAIGKVHQRLGRHRAGLASFERALRLAPPDDDETVEAYREASVCALFAGEPAAAARHCARAVERRPRDPGLIANEAVALLLCGDLDRAEARIKRAFTMAPDDPVSRNVLAGIDAVRRGAVPPPRTMRELTRAMATGIEHAAQPNPEVRLAEVRFLGEDEGADESSRAEGLREYIGALRARVVDFFSSEAPTTNGRSAFECRLRLELHPGGTIEREIVASPHVLTPQRLRALHDVLGSVPPLAPPDAPVRFQMRFEIAPAS